MKRAIRGSYTSYTVVAVVLVFASLDMGVSDQLSEDFDAVPAGALPAGWQVSGGEWKVVAGELIGQSPRGEGRIVVPGGAWADFRLECAVRFLDGAAGERWVAATFGGDGGPVRSHGAILRPDRRPRGGVEYAVRSAAGRWKVRASGASDGALEPSAELSLRLESCRGRVRVSVGERLLLDSAFAFDCGPGSIGFEVGASSAAFDDFRVTTLSPDEVALLAVDYGPLRSIPTIAHRGASRRAPENTLAAIELALELGADAVEFDVYASKDGEIVLMHDKDALRTTDFRAVFGDGKDPAIAALELEELRRLDAGRWKAPQFSGERVPTLAEALEVLHGKAIAVVEIKPDGIGRDVAGVIRRAGMESEVFVQSFSPRAIREFREELPSVATGFLTSEFHSIDPVLRARLHIAAARTAGASAVVSDYRLADPEYVREIHRHAMALWVYTVDDLYQAEVLVRLGIDGIITNVPSRVRGLLAAGRGREPAHRPAVTSEAETDR